MNFLKPLSPLLRKLSRIYTSKEREFSFKEIKVSVRPGVFHPALFFSTKILLGFVEELYLDNKSFLELGAGSGVISILAAKKGASVYASDISRTAIENVRINAERNAVKINLIESDLFNNIPAQKFDFIIINPPYYKQDPETEEEYAWFCGKDYQYFRRLFNSLPGFIKSSTKLYMILSEVCEIKIIKSIGEGEGFNWKIMKLKNVWGEKNFIYSLQYKEHFVNNG